MCFVQAAVNIHTITPIVLWVDGVEHTFGLEAAFLIKTTVAYVFSGYWRPHHQWWTSGEPNAAA